MCTSLNLRSTSLAIIAAIFLTCGLASNREARAGAAAAQDQGALPLPALSFTIPGGGVIPLVANMTGTAQGTAAAGATGLSALANAATPSAGPGPIATVGPPAVGGTVGYPITIKAYSSPFGSATATTGATSIRGIPTGPGGGVINAVSIVELTPVAATASGIGFANATASVSTDPFELAPLSQPQDVVLNVDLVNSAENPGGSVRLFANASGDASASISFSLQATTNIPGLASLFNLSFALDSSTNAVNVTFSSPLISQPIFSSDFVANGPGDFTLASGKTAFSVPFTIPAGVLGNDPSVGDIGLLFNANDSSAANAVSTPEPSTLTLSVAGVCGLLFLRRQRTRLGQINCGVDRRDKWTGLVLEEAVTWLGEEQELGIAQFPSEVAN